MEKKLRAEDIKKPDGNFTYLKLHRKTTKLARKIADIKKIKIPKTSNCGLLCDIVDIFNCEFFMFAEGIEELVDVVEAWYGNCNSSEETYRQNVENYIKKYNNLIDILEKYSEIEQEIQQVGYNKLVLQRQEKLRNLFMEMLTFKEKKFDINDKFSDLLKKVDIYYNVYSDKLYNAEKAINNHIVSVNVEDNYVHLNDVEVIFYLDSLYDTLTYEGDGYKENAHFYKDFDLEEGQTWDDLRNIELAKFTDLFKEILDFLGVEYDKKEQSMYKLRALVISNYPYYEDALRSLISHDLKSTYIEQLDHMERVYENISKTYRNYDENMKAYYIANAVDVEFIPNNEDYKVSYLSALKIANKNLKDDFVKTYDGQVTNLSFEKYEVSQQDYEGDKYWYIKITKADISWYSDEDGELCDGELSGKELEKLQCMVNVNTGKYLHCPCEKY